MPCIAHAGSGVILGMISTNMPPRLLHKQGRGFFMQLQAPLKNEKKPIRSEINIVERYFVCLLLYLYVLLSFHPDFVFFV